MLNRDEHENSKSFIRSNSKFSSKKSDTYAYNKLIKDFESTWNLILKDIKSKSITELLEFTSSQHVDRADLKTTAYIFTVLGYLSTQGKEDEEEKSLFYDLWTLLQGEESNGVTYASLKKILMTIAGFHKGVDTKYDNTNSKSNITYVKIGSIMNKDFTDCIISKKQSQYIHNIFRRLCLNRIQNKQTKQTIKSHSLIKDECIFKPQLNKVSKDLAGKKLRKNKSIGQNIYDSMTNKKKKNNEWRAAQNKIKEQELMREWTFTPEVRSLIRSYHNRSDSKNLLDKSNHYERSNDRCKRHQMSIDKSFTDQDSLQQDKSTVEIKKTAKTSEKCK